MNSIEDYSTIEELDEYFSGKFSLINECLELENIDEQSLTFFRDFENSMIGLRKIFQEIREELDEGHEQLKEMNDLLQTMESLDGKLDHMQKNFPAVLKSQSNNLPKKEKVEVSVAQAPSKQKKLPAKIKCLTLSEFESIPKYMKGRLQYSQVNNFIDTFNKVIESKYKLLHAPRKTLKLTDLKVVNFMKSQESDDTKGKYFCTADNLGEYGNIKMDKSTNTFITILRHCNRIKELRGPGSFIRYVVIN